MTLFSKAIVLNAFSSKMLVCVCVCVSTTGPALHLPTTTTILLGRAGTVPPYRKTLPESQMAHLSWLLGKWGRPLSPDGAGGVKCCIPGALAGGVI